MNTYGARVLYARQPIYDAGLQLAGYELLFRDDAIRNAVPAQFDDAGATHHVLVNAFTGNDIVTMCNYKPAFVNFSEASLSTELPFSPRKLVIEVLESVEPTPEVIETIKVLHTQGYRIALDDYAQYDALHPMLGYADIVKLDYPRFSPVQLATTAAAIRQANPNVILLGEKIETQEDFDICKNAGCALFQGYFLARPKIISGTTMPLNRMGVMQLLSTLNEPDADMASISDVISQDSFLSVHILKLANSALYFCKVSSLREAIMLLGMTRIRAYANLLALSKMQDKPHALQEIAATRGFICQALCETLPHGAEKGFLVGMFSCLDAFFDCDLDKLLATLPLTDEIKRALLSHEGELGLVLHSVIRHEQGRFGDIRWTELADLGIDRARLLAAFEQGVMLSNQTLGSYKDNL